MNAFTVFRNTWGPGAIPVATSSFTTSLDPDLRASGPRGPEDIQQNAHIIPPMMLPLAGLGFVMPHAINLPADGSRQENNMLAALPPRKSKYQEDRPDRIASDRSESPLPLHCQVPSQPIAVFDLTASLIASDRHASHGSDTPLGTTPLPAPSSSSTLQNHTSSARAPVTTVPTPWAPDDHKTPTFSVAFIMKEILVDEERTKRNYSYKDGRPVASRASGMEQRTTNPSSTPASNRPFLPVPIGPLQFHAYSPEAVAAAKGKGKNKTVTPPATKGQKKRPRPKSDDTGKGVKVNRKRPSPSTEHQDAEHRPSKRAKKLK